MLIRKMINLRIKKHEDNAKSSCEKEKSTSKNPLVELPSKLDAKPLFGKKSIRDLQNIKWGKRAYDFTPKKCTNARTNLSIPSPAPEEESKPSTSLHSLNSSHSKVASALVAFIITFAFHFNDVLMCAIEKT